MPGSSPWTEGVARLIAVGGVDASNGKRECKDVYGLILPMGTRPAAGLYGVPAYGSDHPEAETTGSPTAGLTVTNVTFTQRDATSKVWEATVTYSAAGSNSDDSSDTSKYTKLHIGTVTESHDLITDAEDDTKSVLNAAGDPFESVPQVEKQLVEIQLARNQNVSPASDIASLNGTLNSSAITVCGISIPEKCGRISIDGDRLFGEENKWSVTFRIVVNPDGWVFKVLENGYRYKPLDGGDPVKFTSTTDDGRVVECSSPQLLKPDGSDGRGGPAYYAEFNAYKSASWSGLKLPSSL